MVLPFLCVRLACFLHHRKHLHQLHTEKSAVSKIAIYTSREVFALDEQVVIRSLSCEEESSFAVRLTGIPPHVAHLAFIRSTMRGELQALGPSLLKEFEKMLDDQTFGGVLSAFPMVTKLIQKVVGSSLKGIKVQLNGMRNEMMINNEHNGADKVETTRQSSFESQLFLHLHDGILRGVPVGWQFPRVCTVAIAY